MSAEHDRIAVQSSQEANKLRVAFRHSSIADVRTAYADATTQPARWLDKPRKVTTLAAVFVTDYTAAIVAGEYTDERRRLLAELVLDDPGTLRAVHLLSGSLHRIAELLGPLSDLTPEEVASRIDTASGK